MAETPDPTMVGDATLLSRVGDHRETIDRLLSGATPMQPRRPYLQIVPSVPDGEGDD